MTVEGILLLMRAETSVVALIIKVRAAQKALCRKSVTA